MTSMITEKISDIFLVSVLGGMIGLDRTAAGQFMISQPIVAGPLIGWVLGDAITGLIIGALLELIWMMDIPVGTFVPADSTVAAVFATAIAILGSGGRAPVPVMGFAVLLTVLLVPITMSFDGIVRKWNSRLAEKADAGPGENASRKLSRAHLSGLGVFFLKSFSLYLVLLPVGLVLVIWFMNLPERIHGAMSLFLMFLPILGVASAARKLSVETVDRFLVAGFIVTAVLSIVFQLNTVLVILLVATAGWVGVAYREE